MTLAQKMTAEEFLRLPPDPGAWTRELALDDLLDD
jgi:hypothetical protein